MVYNKSAERATLHGNKRDGQTVEQKIASEMILKCMPTHTCIIRNSGLKRTIV